MTDTNLDTFLIIHFVDKSRAIWKIASGPCERISERHHTEREPLVEKMYRNVRLLKNQSVDNVTKTILKHFPDAEPIVGVHEDARLEANRLCDLGEVFVGEFREYSGKWSFDCRMTNRMAENFEYIHPDGTLDRFVNVITGKKYPVPGEGEAAYRISYSYEGGVSGTDYHAVTVAKTPREAIEKLLAQHEKQFTERPDKFGFLAESCKREKLVSASAVNIETDETFWFSGPDLTENDHTRALGNLFTMVADDSEYGFVNALLGLKGLGQ